MKIRRASNRDLTAMISLMERSSAYDGEYRRMLEGYAVTEQQVRNDQIYVAEAGNELLGFYSLVAEKSELDLMFVSDGAQGSGVGAALFKHMSTLARSLEICTVRIVSHPPAEDFYIRMGARRTGLLPGRGKITWARPVMEYSVSSHA